MTTNNDVAFNNWFYDRFKDTDVSAYASHEFIKAKSNMRYGYNAAKAEIEKEIAELKALANRPVTDNTQVIANMEAQIAEANESEAYESGLASSRLLQITYLQSHINRLRELLSEARDDVYEVLANYEQNLPYKQHRYDAQKQLAHGITEALSSTPAQSLQAHDDNVIERCAKVCIDAQPDYVDNSVYHECAKAIREMKGK